MRTWIATLSLLALGGFVGCDDDDTEPTETDTDTDTDSDGDTDTDEDTDTDDTDVTEQQLALTTIASGLTSPVALAWADDAAGRLYVVDQIGLVRTITDGTLDAEPWLDLRDEIVSLNPGYDERGLLGLAFHPDFGADGRFYAYYSVPLREGAPDGYDHTNVLVEWTVGDDGRPDPSTKRVLIQQDWPYFDNNGGTVRFGPDGYLYVALGDGGNKNDIGLGHAAIGNGQLTGNLLGSMLRIDVDQRPQGRRYGIPDDNPFFGSTTEPQETYAWGFRNPSRFSFDALTGELLLADVGQDVMEEIDSVVLGGNYGWNVKEGFLCFDPTDEFAPPVSCPDTGPKGDPLVDPIAAFVHTPNPGRVMDPASIPEAAGYPQIGLVAVGGFAYRGPEMPGLLDPGDYVFGVAATVESAPSGKLMVLHDRGPNAAFTPIVTPEALPTAMGTPEWHTGILPWYVLGIGEGPNGEIYALVNDTLGPQGTTGRVLRLDAVDIE